MKLFVRSSVRSPDRLRADIGTSSALPTGAWGRFRNRWNLFNWMTVLVGLLMVADFASIGVPPPLQYLVYGGFLGAMGGTEVVVRRERREGEMPPDQVRRILRISAVLGVLAGALAIAVQVALGWRW